LAVALAVPLIGLLAVAAFQVNRARQTAQEAEEQAELATATLGFDTLHEALLTERNITGSYLRGVGSLVDLPVDSIEEARPLTDQALEEFRATVDSKGPAIQEAYQPAFDAIDGQSDAVPSLSDLRTRVDEFTGERSILIEDPISPETWDQYTIIVDLLFEGYNDLALEIDDPELRRGATLIHLASRQGEVIAQLVRELVVAEFSSAAPGVDDDERLTIGGFRSELRDNEATMLANAVGPYGPLVERVFESNQVQRFPDVVDTALESGEVDIEAAFEFAVSQEEFGYSPAFAQAVQDELVSQADDVVADATRQQLLYGGVAAGALLLAVVVTYLVSRSITRPLRSLTEQASSMANEQLPEAVQDILETPLGEDVSMPHTHPIEVNTRDEVADVADALDTVQDSALELAVEQAVLRRNIADSFVNLGRRNQNLLGRQLDFITELEQNETDPDTLANLFRLDHLATRMRRNAESLLVLAGIDPPRKWAAPVQLTDVIRAALGEVEDYQRITVRAVEPATIVGSAAADLAHLLAELIENALVFSPPDQTVEIRGRAHGPNASHDAAYTLAVIDSGLGMSPEEITRANRRLAGQESFTIAPSKYLGHYVAGSLAARHGINVQLHNVPADPGSNGTGITATVNVPSTVLTDHIAGPIETAPGAPPLTHAIETAPSGIERPSDQPAPPAPEPAHTTRPVARTNGGLVKRSPPPVSGDSPYPPAAAVPDGSVSAVSQELLQTLATYTTQLHRRVNPQRPPTPPTGHPLPQFPPSSPPSDPARSTPPSGMPLGYADRPSTSAATPTTHSATPQHTSSGLTRRVPGAQKPAADPLSLRHEAPGGDAETRGNASGGEAPVGGAPQPDAGSEAGETAMGSRSARDVYDFLSSFSAGVQRGLDEAAQTGRAPEPPAEEEQ
jgi:signal transduction histidine kinase